MQPAVIFKFSLQNCPKKTKQIKAYAIPVKKNNNKKKASMTKNAKKIYFKMFISGQKHSEEEQN